MKERRLNRLVLPGLALGAAMAVGTAQAEPLTLSADQIDQVTAAGEGFANFNATLTENSSTSTSRSICKRRS